MIVRSFVRHDLCEESPDGGKVGWGTVVEGDDGHGERRVRVWRPVDQLYGCAVLL